MVFYTRMMSLCHSRLYPFGSTLPSRSWSDVSRAYRYGFNGKEKDAEGMGGGNSTYDYGFRIYNPSLGKFLSVDPLLMQLPWNSTYSFAENEVILCIDLEGLEKWAYLTQQNTIEITQGPYSIDYAKKCGYQANLTMTNNTKLENAISVGTTKSPEFALIMEKIKEMDDISCMYEYEKSTNTVSATINGEDVHLVSMQAPSGEWSFNLIKRIAFESTNVLNHSRIKELQQKAKEDGKNNADITTSKNSYIIGILKLEAEAKLNELLVDYELKDGKNSVLNKDEYEKFKTDAGKNEFIENASNKDFISGTRTDFNGIKRSVKEVYGEQYDEYYKEGQKDK